MVDLINVLWFQILDSENCQNKTKEIKAFQTGEKQNAKIC